MLQRDIGVPVRRPRGRMRSRLAWLHRWLGLSVGVLFALVSLAGAVLVFHTEWLLAMRPQLAEHTPVVRAEVMGRLLQQWAPQGLTALDLPQAALPVWQGYLADGRRVYFAPEDGALLLVRSHSDDRLMWLHHWHVQLLAGDTGKDILGLAGWAAVALMVSGLYLWWPKRGRIAAHLRWHAGQPVRRWLSWHRSSGALLGPLLALATVTGLGMIYSAGFRTVLVAALGAAPPVPPAPMDGPVQPLDWGAVLARAQAAIPGGRIARVAPPEPGAEAIRFRVRAAGEWHPVGRSLVMVRRDGSAVLQHYDATRDRAGVRLHNAIYPLHVAAVGGLPMKLLQVLAGLAPAFLLVTGVLFWWRPRTGGRTRTAPF